MKNTMNEKKITPITQMELNKVLTKVETNLSSIRTIINENNELEPEYNIKFNKILNESQQHINKQRK